MRRHKKSAKWEAPCKKSKAGSLELEMPSRYRPGNAKRDAPKGTEQKGPNKKRQEAGAKQEELNRKSTKQKVTSKK